MLLGVVFDAESSEVLDWDDVVVQYEGCTILRALPDYEVDDTVATIVVDYHGGSMTIYVEKDDEDPTTAYSVSGDLTFTPLSEEESE